MSAKYNELDKEKGLAIMATNINPETQKPNWSYCEKQTGVSRRTLEKWWLDKDNEDEIAQLRTQKKVDFINEAWKEVVAAMRELPSKRQSANYKDTIVGIATLIDKVQLMNNEPTAITKNSNDNNTKLDLSNLTYEQLLELSKNEH